MISRDEQMMEYVQQAANHMDKLDKKQKEEEQARTDEVTRNMRIIKEAIDHTWAQADATTTDFDAGASRCTQEFAVGGC